jgi:aspartate kinase
LSFTRLALNSPLKLIGMKVFKFGGASVKDAAAVRNVESILNLFNQESLIVVVSAMGKTTNALEKVVDARWAGDREMFLNLVAELRDFHHAILVELFGDANHRTYKEVSSELDLLEMRIHQPRPDNYDFEYDQIVSLGEVISTRIVAGFLSQSRTDIRWEDARRLIRTDRTYREGEVDWDKTAELVESRLVPQLTGTNVVITQGFLGHTAEGFTTTLGREGSDYTAGILAFTTNAESVTIWKDVPGMLNADPKWFDNTIKLDRISFKEAIELSYYGASVIHPKTVKPLQNKGIPLYVKSFVDPHAEGTVIQADGTNDHVIPSFIFKMDQVLISIMPKDFSFIVEKNLSTIFNTLDQLGVKMNLMQNSALSFSLLVDRKKIDLDHVISVLSRDFVVKYNDNLELVTIRHYDQATLDRVTVNKDILLEQKTRETARLVMKDRG